MRFTVSSCARRSLAVVSLLWPAASLARAGEVWVVAPSGGQFTSIQEAIDAASSGDIILLRPNPAGYAPFDVSGKSLAILSDAEEARLVLGEMSVRDLGAKGMCALSWLSTNGQGFQSRGLFASNCLGAVRVQESSFVALGNPVPTLDKGIQAAECADFVLFHVLSVGGGWGSTTHPGTGGQGLSASTSTIHAIASELRGGKGGSGNDDEGQNGGGGGNGLMLLSGLASCVDSNLIGAAGGEGEPGDGGTFGCEDGGNGGAGGNGAYLFTQLGLTTKIRHTGSTMQGAPGGSGAQSFCGGSSGSPGPDGLPVRIFGAGTEVALGSPARYLTAKTIVRESQFLQVRAKGQVGDQVWLRIERFVPNMGSLAAPQLAKHSFLGVIPAGGVLVHLLTVPELGPGVEGRILRLNPLFIDGVGASHSAPDFVSVVVDSAF